MAWFVTGGAGYIGAHVVAAMRRAGHEVVVLDDLSSGSAVRIPDDVPLVAASVLDDEAIRAALGRYGIDGIIHLAARKRVDESVAHPLLYYRDNVEGLRRLIGIAVDSGIERFVFSSSAAVYGTPDAELVDEDAPCRPINPYGETKLAGEWLVRSVAAATGMRTVSLRYFNVAGAASPALGDPSALNLIPRVFERVAAGQPPVLFGDDYPTPDGSCVRDFLHVTDVAAAHVAAAERIDGFAQPVCINLGRGRGYSVREVLRVIGEVTGLDTSPVVADRRPGDPARVVASAGRARDLLGWSAREDLRAMVESAWAAWQGRVIKTS